MQDHLGSTVALTSATGAITSSASYDSFGNPTGNLATRYQYTGREYDSTVGLYYYRNRFYDAKLGRFISEDPIGLNGGINQFGYVNGNPVSFTDPNGKIPILIPLIAGGIAIGGLILASPTPVNAPGPGDPIYYPDNPLILNAAGGAICGGLLSKFGGPVLNRIISGSGSDIIELGISQGPIKVASSVADDAASAGFTTVGRWMTRVEYEAMKETGRVIEGAGGKTSVATKGPTSFGSQAKPGTVYVEFDVPTNSLVTGGSATPDWYSIIGPNANRVMTRALEKQGGEMLPKFQNLTEILQSK